MNSKEKKRIEKRREDIMMTVPTFINQLLLLLSSGMVLQEALETIAKKYGEEDFKARITSLLPYMKSTGRQKKTEIIFSRDSAVSAEPVRSRSFQDWLEFSRTAGKEELICGTSWPARAKRYGLKDGEGLQKR